MWLHVPIIDFEDKKGSKITENSSKNSLLKSNEGYCIDRTDLKYDNTKGDKSSRSRKGTGKTSGRKKDDSKKVSTRSSIIIRE